MGLFSKDIKNLEDLYQHGLKDIYYAENQIVKSLPDMIENTTNAELKRGLQHHLRESRSDPPQAGTEEEKGGAAPGLRAHIFRLSAIGLDRVPPAAPGARHAIVRGYSADAAAAKDRRQRHQGSIANRSRPAGFSVLASKVRISMPLPVSTVTVIRSSATAVAMMREPFGSSAVTSAAGALPSPLKTR